MKAVITFLMFISTGFAEELSFQKALNMMLENNPELQQQKLQTDIAEQQVWLARTSYLPQVDLSYGLSHSNNPVYAFGSLLNQERFGPDNFAIDALNRPDSLTDMATKLQLGWMLYDFGRRESRVESSRIARSISSLQFASVRSSVLLELVKRYHAVALAESRGKTAEEAAKASEQRVQQARDRVTEGIAVQADLLSAEVFHARRKQELVDAENQRRLAIAALEEVIGSSLPATLTISEIQETTHAEYDLPYWENLMLAHRPELEVVRQNERLAASSVKQYKAAFLPVVQLWAGYEWHGETFEQTGNNGGAGVELKWNVFRGYSDALQLSVAQLERKKAAEELRKVENQFRLQLKNSYYSFRSAAEKMKIAKAALEQARENRRIFAERYTGGLVTIHDSLQAEVSYSEMQLFYLQNLYELKVAYATLLSVAGQSDELMRMQS